MRRSYHEVGFVGHDGNTIGVCLGFNFCSEHEEGIRDLKKHLDIRADERTAFGFVKPLLGLESRKVNYVDERSLIWHSPKKNEAYLIFIPLEGRLLATDSPERFMKIVNSVIEHDLKFFGSDEEIVAAWDSRSFGIHVKGQEAVENLHSLYEAFLKKDVAFVSLRHNNPFSNNGLCLMQYSKFPKNVAEKLKEADQDRLNLLKTVKKSGIEQILRDNGKGWYALSPIWVADFHDRKNTKFDVMFWLNPMEQHRHQCGWYSIEELKLWARDRGPVMKTDR